MKRKQQEREIRRYRDSSYLSSEILSDEEERGGGD